MSSKDTVKNLDTSNVFVSPEYIRNRFSTIMSEMYKNEVPLYGKLLDLVHDINKDVLSKSTEIKEQLAHTGEITRLNMERHGAIRLGKPYELFTMRRLFKVMGMYPVGYYDLATAGVPVHSTAFRAIENTALNQAPFRVFTSLLRLDLIDDDILRTNVETILENRQIFTEKALELINKSEKEGGLNKEDAESFVQEALETFRWHDTATVDYEMYEALLGQHRLIADVVAFKGPHINHLTPRTLDIDKVQSGMEARNIPPKDNIEGPPARKCPILLRQTSFKALTENVTFKDNLGKGKMGEHKARFGEIEQRGVALTQKGLDLYNELLGKTRKAIGGSPTTENASEYNQLLTENFKVFPDNYQELQSKELAYFHYFTTNKVKNISKDKVYTKADVNQLLENDCLTIEPMVYEDFLPVSAAGIFASNLGTDDAKREYEGTSNQSLFEKDLGKPVYNLMKWYEDMQEETIQKCLSQINT
ncbi:putative glyoxalase superfamily metalloenzyme YdcJ [Tenacibaculum adriaticum]|uniref:2-oxoadipate dioxygenase/decarboxylase n=1 Tax=Tenacibaculum adriaticum TaxID=413713 RepID=A0A5S5DJK3_9FLAO|nr:VOC family protein [Tenacibaculum adriaticum]TYP96071.1 putative glyoxalase superfamily metalloenzyme YdcJ [Tenacibaculum adriaticum]